MGLLKLASSYTPLQKKSDTEDDAGSNSLDLRRVRSLRFFASGDNSKFIATLKPDGFKDPIEVDSNGTILSLRAFTDAVSFTNFNASSMSKFRSQMKSQIRSEVYMNVQNARKLLSVEQNPPYREAIKGGILNDLIEILSTNHHPQILLEAAWCISNLASGSSMDTTEVINSGAPELLNGWMCYDSNDPLFMSVREQCAWGLGNIAGDSTKARDMVLALEPSALVTLMEIMRHESAPVSAKRTCIWAMSNLLRNKPYPPFHVVGQTTDFLIETICDNSDSEVVNDAIWALSYATDGSDIICRTIASNSRLLVKLISNVKLFSHNMRQSLRIIGNLVSGDEPETQAAINAGAVPALKNLLGHSRRELRREACWALSNIAAGSAAQIQALLNEDLFNIVRPLMQIDHTDCAKDAIYFVTNILLSGNAEQITSCSSVSVVIELLEILNKPFVTSYLSREIINSFQNSLLHQRNRNSLPAFFERRLREVVQAMVPFAERARDDQALFPIFQTMLRIFSTYIEPYDSTELGLKSLFPYTEATTMTRNQPF